MAEPLSLALLGLVLAAVGFDLLIGDPRRLPHPVVGVGQVITRLEAALNHGSPVSRRCKGALMTALVVLGTGGLGWVSITLLARVHPWLGWLAEGWLLASCLAIKGLRDAALAVATPLASGDLPGARRALSMIVGRDTVELDEAEIARGTVETVAENSVDGITAPLFFALLGGAPLALAYKAINTLDSMVGYRNARYLDFGWASARLDDLANWLPARLTALTLWLGARPSAGWRSRGALVATRREAPRHLSPNSGWPEAMVANLLGVQLGGNNHYLGELSERARLGSPHEALGARHIPAAVRLMHGGWVLFLALLALVILFKEMLT
ncbi:adenosylcobinamide-phosphate synthase CbiB [Halomonas marinisediminis]|uniref:Cobalamin biosynthesis protein CobD n=1 Tax=Halomonas marinisediminis TaxID=2546095 RepID=A0ABY2DAI0_9GAMM|nr:adenosylcobinamide-phosphate synthase CbiB [Halomonas marinisediminis]TDB05176.1 cobalamin biosynthesis protein CobD [Halomonas marinisediminis]